jgi:hypothetical protein
MGFTGEASLVSGGACLLAAVEFVDEAARSELIDEAQVNKIFRLYFSRFGIP